MPGSTERPQSAVGDRALTLREVAALLTAMGVDVSVYSIGRFVQAGTMPSLRVGRRTWIFESDLREWLKRGGHRPREPEPVTAA